MKKIIVTIIFMLTLATSSFADFTIKDLFISGGSDKPVESKGRTVHDCNA